MFSEPRENKLNVTKRGNQKSNLNNPGLVNILINKEDWYSHLIPLHNWVSKITSHDLVLNDQTPTDKKAEVTVGTVQDNFKQQIQHEGVLSICNCSLSVSRHKIVLQVPKNQEYTPIYQVPLDFW